MNKDKIVCGIYKIQNKNNKQIYIGQSINIYERFRKHKQIPDNFNIHKAMKEEGIDNFTFEIIEECPQELLNEREKYWVSYYDSYNNGYNMTTGGAGAPMSNNKKVKQYDLQGNYIKTFLSEREAAQELQTDARYISNCCLHKNNTILNYQFCFEGDETSIKINPKTNPGAEKIPVLKYNLQGKFICNYNSIKEAAKEHHNDEKGIAECCRKQAYSCQGFLWTFKGDPVPEPYNSKRAHTTTARKVNQYDLQDNYIRTFDSCKEAAESVGLTSATCIVRVCNGKQKTTKGYKWKYCDN